MEAIDRKTQEPVIFFLAVYNYFILVFDHIMIVTLHYVYFI